MNGNVQTPTQEVSEDAKMRTIAMYAPSKTFNLAGLVGSYHVIFNKYLRERMDKVASLSHYNSINVMSMHALVGAYSETGREWVDELLEVLSSNVNYAYDYICKNFKGVKLAKPEGTYMLYLDCEEWCKEHNMSMDDLLKAIGGVLDNGARRVTIHLPYDKGGILETLYQQAKVESVEYGQTIDIKAVCTPRIIGQLGPLVEGWKPHKEPWED